MSAWILILVALSTALSLPTTALLIRLAHRWRHYDHPDAPASGGRKDHHAPTPNLGGIAITLAVLLPLIAVWCITHLPEPWLSEYLPPLAEHLQGLRSQSHALLSLIALILCIHVLGLLDDRLRLGPRTKLLFQLFIALFAVFLVDVKILELLRVHGLLGELAVILLSVLWILIITNALNFLDNMDGLAAGVGSIITAIYLTTALLNGQWFIAGLAACLLGGLLGFLIFNRPPARIFMGDGGSLVLGFLLAVISARTTYFSTDLAASSHLQLSTHWHSILMPVMVLAIPLYDFGSVVILRLAQGRSPMQGDQQHFSHRLLRLGLSRPAAVSVIILATLASGLSGIMLPYLQPWQALLAGGQTLCILATLALLEWCGQTTSSRP